MLFVGDIRLCWIFTVSFEDEQILKMHLKVFFFYAANLI